jgi:hypothetical protein
MSSYGRNFEFRVPPDGDDRSGRYALDSGSDDLPIGAPVVVTGDFDDLGRATVELAAEGAGTPLPGVGGILVFEYAPAAFAGDDPLLTTYSDKGTVVAGSAVQVVSGPQVKVVLRNTGTQNYLHLRTYEAFNLVASAIVGATPAVVGDLLTPGAGNGTAGFWKKTTDATKAWLVVSKVDTARGEVEARLNF